MKILTTGSGAEYPEQKSIAEEQVYEASVSYDCPDDSIVLYWHATFSGMWFPLEFTDEPKLVVAPLENPPGPYTLCLIASFAILTHISTEVCAEYENVIPDVVALQSDSDVFSLLIQEALVLDASASYDPVSPDATLTYEWYCYQDSSLSVPESLQSSPSSAPTFCNTEIPELITQCTTADCTLDPESVGLTRNVWFVFKVRPLSEPLVTVATNPLKLHAGFFPLPPKCHELEVSQKYGEVKSVSIPCCFFQPH